MYGWYSDNSVFLEDPGVYLRPSVYSVVVLEESSCPRESSRTNFQVLVLVLVRESQVLDNTAVVYCLFSAKFRDGFRQLLITGGCCRWARSTSGHRRWSEAAVTTFVDHNSPAQRTLTRPSLTVALEMRAV